MNPRALRVVLKNLMGIKSTQKTPMLTRRFRSHLSLPAVDGWVCDVPRAVYGVRFVNLWKVHHGLWGNVSDVTLPSPANE